MKIQPKQCKTEGALSILVGKWKPIIFLRINKLLHISTSVRTVNFVPISNYIGKIVDKCKAIIKGYFVHFVEMISKVIGSGTREHTRKVNDMLKRNLLKKLFKSLPNNEQSMYEKKLTCVMKSLKVQNYNFNWDRTSCFVEFNYNQNFYRLEHSIEKAKKNGLFLHNGLDCLMELTQSLEDICGIIDRGMYDFETWLSGMKQSPSETKMPGFQEELEIRYKTVGRQNFGEYTSEDHKEHFPYGNEPSLKEFQQSQINQRSLDKKSRFEEIVSKL